MVPLPRWVAAPFASPWSGGAAGGVAPLRPPRHGPFPPPPSHGFVRREGTLLGTRRVASRLPWEKTLVLGPCSFWGHVCNPNPPLTPPHPTTKSYQELKMEEFQAKLKNLVVCYCHTLSVIKPLLVCGQHVSRGGDCRCPLGFAGSRHPSAARTPCPGLSPSLGVSALPGAPRSSPHRGGGRARP